MDPYLMSLTRKFKPVGNLAQDVEHFLHLHKRPGTAVHCSAVAFEARRLAGRFGINLWQSEAAGWLHDISAVWPAAERLEAARQLGVEILPEEASQPFILHQKLSVVLAREIFQVGDAEVLSAVGCHTTLKSASSALDQTVFIADKLAWDQAGEAPFHSDLRAALENSLEEACRVYLRYLHQQRASLLVAHPWTVQAYEELCGKPWQAAE